MASVSTKSGCHIPAATGIARTSLPHESQHWIDQQRQKLVPGNYFMITFTLPAELRALAWHHQREMYALITRNAWDTVNTFSRNEREAYPWGITSCAAAQVR